MSLALSVQIPEFYANALGLGLVTVGVVFMAVRLADLALDPVIGALIDRTQGRWGRFRPWLIGGTVLMMGTVLVSFTANRGANVVGLIASLFLLYLSYSVVLLAHTAWAARLAPGHHERSRVFAWLQNVAVGAMLFASALLAATPSLAPGDKTAGVRFLGWFIIATGPLTTMMMAVRTPEPLRAPAPAAAGPLSILARLGRLARQPSILRLLAADFGFALSSGVTSALFIFYFRDARGYHGGGANQLLLVYLIGALLGAPLWLGLAKRLGKHRTLIAAALYTAALQGTTLLLPRGVWIAAAPVLLFGGLAYSAPTIFIRSMLADAADEALLNHGVEDTSVLFALVTSTQKTASAVSVGLAFPALAVLGFTPQAGAAGEAAGLGAVQAVFVIAPATLLLLTALVLSGYRLTEARHHAIQTALAAAASGAGRD